MERENVFDNFHDKYIHMLYATGGHAWTSLKNGTEMFYYEGKVYYEGRGCFKHPQTGRLYLLVDDKLVIPGKNIKQIGYTLSLNLAVYLLARADGKVYSIEYDTSESRYFFVIVTNKGVYTYNDTNNFYDNYHLIEYLCEAFKDDMEKYKLTDPNP